MSEDLNKKIHDLIAPPIELLGFELVTLTFKGGKDNKILEILIETKSGAPISIEDCRHVSKNISVILDVEELIEDKYLLEVSSCGLERPLVKLKDFEKYLNNVVKIKLNQALENTSNFRGKIIRVEGEQIFINAGGKEVIIPFNLIKSARLVLTDEKFREILNRK